MVKQIATVEDFDKEVKKFDGVVLVDFYAEWCGPCQYIKPFLEELSEKTPSIKFIKVDVDEAEAISTSEAINCMPTFKLFKNGEVVEEFSGASQEKLQELINKYK